MTQWSERVTTDCMAFLAFEGLDGSGKSTLIQSLQSYLVSVSVEVTRTREPGGTNFGQEIRQLLLRTQMPHPTSTAELFLYCADRAQHVEQVIRPQLEQKHWVLCDRYYGSTHAFQCGGRGIDEKVVLQLSEIAIQGLEPDLWVLLDLPVEESQNRTHKRGQGQDRFEQEEFDFHQRVRQAYLNLAKKNRQNWLVIDAMKTPDNMFQILLKALKEKQWLE